MFAYTLIADKIFVDNVIFNLQQLAYQYYAQWLIILCFDHHSSHSWLCIRCLLPLCCHFLSSFMAISSANYGNYNDCWSILTPSWILLSSMINIVLIFQRFINCIALFSHQFVICISCEIIAIGYLGQKRSILPIFVPIASNPFEHINIYTP